MAAKKIRKRTTRPSTRRVIRNPRTTSVHTYRPYHPHGEVVFLITVALVGIIYSILPLPFFVKLIGSILLFVTLPTIVFTEYWPKLSLHHLGWQLPERPRTPLAYSALVILLSFLPLWLFLAVPDPTSLAAVQPQGPWLAWLISQGLVSIIILCQTAFFTGLILFRLTHLLKPWQAMIIVAVILTVSQLFLPGTLRYYALPLSLAFTWMAWQTKSFAPVAVMQILLSLTFDLYVRLT